MMVSELTPKDVQSYLRIEPAGAKEKLKTEQELSIILSAALDFCRSYTGLTRAEMDRHHDLTVAVLVLCSDMYDNRQLTIPAGGAANAMVRDTLDRYRRNLL